MPTGKRRLVLSVMCSAAALSLLLWIAGAAYDALFFYKDTHTFWQLLISDVPAHDLFIRLGGMGMLLLFGIVVSSLLWRQQTAKARQENKLRESEARFRCAIESAPIPVMLHAEDGEVLELNSMWTRLTGYTAEDIRTISDWTRRAYGQKAKALQEHIRTLYKTEKTSEATVFEVRCKNAETRLWEFHSARLGRLPDGRRLVESMARDITEQSEAEAARINLLQAVENSREAIIITAPDGMITYANRAAEKMHGYSKEALEGCHVSLLNAGAEPAAITQGIMDAVVEEGFWEGQLQCRQKDGSEFTAFATVSATRNNDGEVINYISTKNNITKQLHMEAQLQQSQKLESIGTLASGIAHEINNPINGIMNYAQLLCDQFPNHKGLAEIAQEISHETERVASLVKNLMQFARQDRQTHSPVRVQEMVETTLSLVRAVLRRDYIELEVKVPDNLPRVSCRKQQIEQVLMNLLANARDALNDTGKDDDTTKRITVSARQITVDESTTPKEGRRVEISVQDTGAGIPEHVRNRLFEPFFTTKDRTVGTGLGLAISHGIVKGHGSSLSVESRPGSTTFRFSLPAVDEADDNL